MVLNARPANCFSSCPEGALRSFGTPLQLQYFFVPEDCVVEGYAEELQEFYHSFVVGSERVARNALKVRVKPTQVRRLKAYSSFMSHEDELVPCLRTLAMGDSAAVSLGQSSHLSVLLKSGAVDLQQFISLTGRSMTLFCLRLSLLPLTVWGPPSCDVCERPTQPLNFPGTQTKPSSALWICNSGAALWMVEPECCGQTTNEPFL